MTKSKIFLYFCLAFIGGIFVNSLTTASQPCWLGLLFLGAILIPLFSKHKKPLIVSFCLIFLAMGIWRHQSFMLRIDHHEFSDYIGTEDSVALAGIINRQPDIGEKSVKLEFQADDFEGKILITTAQYPQYQYGDKIEVAGQIEEPMVFEDFNYREYLAKDGIYAVMYFPEIKIIKRGLGNPLMRILFSVTDKLKESLNNIVPYPQSGLLEGLMFGSEGNIPKSWQEKFNVSGTRHITAVSGMNITIISSLVLGFLLAFGFWRNQAFYLSIVFVIFYILIIGAPSSAIRAGIMGILFLMAQYFGRLTNGFRALVLAAALMLFFNPLLLKADVGFQLSFLAALGLILLQPPLFSLFKRVPDKLQLRYSLSATLAAQVFTFPILIYNFGQIPLIGPLANVLIVPLLAPVTILGFFISVLGIIFLPLAQILSFPLWATLTYILKVVDFSSKIPFGALLLKKVSFVWVLTLYLLLGLGIWRWQKKQQLKFLKQTPYL